MSCPMGLRSTGITAGTKSKIIAATRQAEEIYERIVVPALHAAAEEMRATGNLHLIDFAKALETGEYSGLAL